MGRRVRRLRCRNRSAGQALASCCGCPDRRSKLPAAPACRPDSGACQDNSIHHPAAAQNGAGQKKRKTLTHKMARHHIQKVGKITSALLGIFTLALTPGCPCGRYRPQKLGSSRRWSAAGRNWSVCGLRRKAAFRHQWQPDGSRPPAND